SPPGVRKALDGADALLIVGASVFTWFLHSPGDPFPRGLPVVQVDDDAREIGRSYPPTLGIVADPCTALIELTAAMATRLTPAAREGGATRAREIGRTRAEGATRIRAAAEAERERTPISAAHLMRTLAAVAPADAVIVDESATSLPHVLRHLPLAVADSLFASET